MKLADIVVVKEGQAPDNSVFLPSSRDIFSFLEEELAAWPETLGVTDGKGNYGSMQKELLLFLRAACSREQVTAMLETAPVGVVAIDEESRIFYANGMYGTIIGVPRQKVIGRLMSRIEPDAAILEVLSGRQAVQGRTVWIHSVNRYVRVNIAPLMKEGKPWGAVSFFTDVTETTRLEGELSRVQHLTKHLQQELENSRGLPTGFSDIIGKNPGLVHVLQTAGIVAATDAPLLIQGEHGVGKELLARATHAASPRQNRPFITVNCAAVPEALLESELFGYEDGAFTGAAKGGRMGKFELADQGVLFMDEIGDMPMPMQAKLLRVLQEKEIEKLGRSGTVRVNVRVIAATNKDLEQMVRERTFRADLLYRLNMVSLTLPPLRDRMDDLGLLATALLRKCNAKYGKNLSISSQLYAMLHRHNWPGNVRELANILEYAVIMCPEGLVRPEHLPAQFFSGNAEEAPARQKSGSWKEVMAATEKDLLTQALAQCGNNRSQAIRTLGISRKAFYDKLKLYGLH